MQKNLVNKFTYRVEWSEEDHTNICRCLEFPSLTADGATPEKAIQELKKVVLAAIKWLEEEGRPAPEPLGGKNYSGKFALRMPKDTHRQLSIEAAEQEVSLNQLILSKIS